MDVFYSTIKLGSKYLYRYRRRYIFLMVVLVFGFAIITFITSTKDGMYDSVYYSAQSHYAGDIVAVGYDNAVVWEYSHHMGQDEISSILKAASISGTDPQHTVFRTLYGSTSFIHYNGSAIQLRDLVGCDWENESFLFSKMNFDEGPASSLDDDSIFLSAPIASYLGAGMGDMVILELETCYGQKNTGFFIVQGIVQDTSIFAYYKAYISRLSLNRLAVYDDNDCSTIGFFLDEPSAAEQKRAHLQSSLSMLIQTGPLVYDRDGLERERKQPWNGTIVFLYTMPVYLSEISNILDAINLISYLLYGMMLIIILVSASGTYRLIIHERTKEIGTMRVIGFYGKDLHFILWSEILFLGLISLFVGFLVSYFLSWLVSLLSFSWFPGFEIFLKNNRLIALYLPGTILLNTALIFAILIMMTLKPSLSVSHKKLPALLSGESL